MTDTEIHDLLENPTHHAYLIASDRHSHFEKFRLAVRKKVVAKELEASDVSSRVYETVSIDDARAIIEIQNTMPVGSRRVMLISLATIQSEAQNSLLKLFEEASHTIFFVFADSAAIFLPTVLSRFYRIEIKNSGSRSKSKAMTESLVPEFLTGSVKKRLDLLEPIIKEKDKFVALDFLNDLEQALHNKKGNAVQSSSPHMSLVSIFEDIFQARHFLRSRSPSVKMILENLASTIPRNL